MKASFCTIIVDLNEEHTAFSQCVGHHFETSQKGNNVFVLFSASRLAEGEGWSSLVWINTCASLFIGKRFDHESCSSKRSKGLFFRALAMLGFRDWFPTLVFQISHQFNQSKKKRSQSGTSCTRPFVESTHPILVEKHGKKRDQLYMFVRSRGLNKLNFGPQAYNVQM